MVSGVEKIDKMTEKPYLYFNIRVPKSASTSLQNIVEGAFPDAQYFDMVGEYFSDKNISPIENFRAFRKFRSRLWKNYSVFSPEKAWKIIEDSANQGDVVSGHFGIEEIDISRFEKRLITLIRHPVYRLLSDYNYKRNGYKKRNFVKKLYHGGRIMAAGKYSFEGYIDFLSDNNIPTGRVASHFILGDTAIQDKKAFMQEKYFAFGTVEKLDTFKKSFESKTGTQTEVVHKNITHNKHRSELSQKEIQAAEKYCAEDMELYEVINSLV